MCCLGFYSLACGYSIQEIDGLLEPEITENHKYPKTFADSFDLIYDLIRCNDNILMSDLEREENIIRLFAKIGVSVTIED